MPAEAPLSIAVVGSGIAGLACAWLLAARHRVTLYEAAGRLGGHSNTVEVPGPDGPVPVDTGFIVFNEATYPNLIALFAHLGVETVPSGMSFAVSLDGGRLEYNGTDLRGLFAQPSNLVRPRFWAMLRELLRFYREAPGHAGTLGEMSLGTFLDAHGFGAAFRDDHLLPMAAAIWSAPAKVLLDYPAEAFIRFCDNHGLLKVSDRPAWRTVVGGSRRYVAALADRLGEGVRQGCGVRRIERLADGVEITDAGGERRRYDHVVIGAHADEALALLADADVRECALLSAFRYGANRAVLHRDPALMPRRRRAWASWNYLGRRSPAEGTAELCVTYWMNRLQPLATPEDWFVTLNPSREPRPETVSREERYTHPIFDAGAMAAQGELWSLQGRRRTWFCGAYFGAGFHEDGLQAGLAVAEELGGVRRPWTVADESGRVRLHRTPALGLAA